MPAHSKTLLDLPIVVWMLIRKELDSPEEEILNLCRSCPYLDNLLRSDFPLDKDKISLTGNPVFSILTENSYFDRRDLVTLTHVNDRFCLFAESSWAFLEFSEDTSSIEFRESADIQRFMDEKLVSKVKGDHVTVSDQFIGKEFIFSGPKTPNSQSFWNQTKLFFQRFGSHILRVKVNDTLNSVEDRHFHEILFQTHPRLQYFLSDWNELWAEVDSRTRERYFTWNPQHHYHTHQNNSQLPSLTYPDPGSGSSGRVRKIYAISFWNHYKAPAISNYKELCLLVCGGGSSERHDLSDFHEGRHLEKLTVNGVFSSTTSFQFAGNFPRLREFTPSNYTPWAPPPMIFSGQGDPVLPEVRKLTLRRSEGGRYSYHPLGCLRRILPSLRELRIVSWEGRASLMEELKDDDLDLDPDLREYRDTVDVYQLYSEGRSLRESNVWRLLPTLRTLSVVTSHEFKIRRREPEVGYRYPVKRLIERYSRLDFDLDLGGHDGEHNDDVGKIVFEKIVRSVTSPRQDIMGLD